jgi:hypothetical protein
MNMLPLYKCHKKVRAAQIIDIIDGEHSVGLTLKDQPNIQHVTHEWTFKHEVMIGGYFVVYEDGYTSFSPQEAFENGYTRVECVNIQETQESKDES